MTTHIHETTSYDADEFGWFGGEAEGFGGRFMPEALMKALIELDDALAGREGRHGVRRGVRRDPA